MDSTSYNFLEVDMKYLKEILILLFAIVAAFSVGQQHRSEQVLKLQEQLQIREYQFQQTRSILMEIKWNEKGLDTWNRLGYALPADSSKNTND